MRLVDVRAARTNDHEAHTSVYVELHGLMSTCASCDKPVLTITLSRCSIRTMVFSSSVRSVLSDKSQSSRYSFSVIHSHSIPSRPRICHHLSPPTTRCSSFGPNHSISASAAWLHDDRGAWRGTTAHQKGAGTCVFVLQGSRQGDAYTQGGRAHHVQCLQRLHSVSGTKLYEGFDDMKCSPGYMSAIDEVRRRYNSLIVKEIVPCSLCCLL